MLLLRAPLDLQLDVLHMLAIVLLLPNLLLQHELLLAEQLHLVEWRHVRLDSDNELGGVRQLVAVVATNAIGLWCGRCLLGERLGVLVLVEDLRNISLASQAPLLELLCLEGRRCCYVVCARALPCDNELWRLGLEGILY